MILRPALPFPLAAERTRPDSHIRLAVAVSIGLHVAAVSYVALMKFTAPPVAELPEGPIIDLPLVKLSPPPPPEKPTPPQPRPVIHESVPFPNPPLNPLPTPVLADPGPTLPGPAASLESPRPMPPPPRDPVIHDPRWVSLPGPDEFSRFYPDRALRLAREGSATLRCQVAASGQLHDCQVTDETPENLGFGQAALKLARYMRIAPKTIDGQPVDGGILVEPIRFRLK